MIFLSSSMINCDTLRPNVYGPNCHSARRKCFRNHYGSYRRSACSRSFHRLKLLPLQDSSCFLNFSKGGKLNSCKDLLFKRHIFKRNSWKNFSTKNKNIS